MLVLLELQTNVTFQRFDNLFLSIRISLATGDVDCIFVRVLKKYEGVGKNPNF
jgi:hypothetical protein